MCRIYSFYLACLCQRLTSSAAADILCIKDIHPPSPAELTLLTRSHIVSTLRQRPRVITHSPSTRFKVAITGLIILITALPSIDFIHKSNLALSAIINISVALSFACGTQTTRLSMLPPGPPLLKKQALHEYRHRLEQPWMDLHARDDKPRALLSSAARPKTSEDASPLSRLSFYVDSGASFHIHHRLSDFINIKHNSTSVSGVDHKAHQCTHVGDLPLQVCTHDNKVVSLLLRNVRCVPTFTDSLISVR